MNLNRNQIHLNEDHITKWFKILREKELVNIVLHNTNPVFAINTPSVFKILPNVLARLKDKYDPHKEKGGIMLARPIHAKDRNEKYFEVYDLVFLENIMPKDQQENNYMFDEEDLQIALQHSFSKKTDKRISYPIVFHTHPTINESNFGRMLKYYSEIVTSPDDQNMANMVRRYKKTDFAIPNALVVINPKLQGQFFIGFFGGYIAPECFEDYMKNLTGKTLKEIYQSIVDWSGDDNVKKVLLSVGAVVLLGLGIYNAKNVIPFVILLFVSNVIPLTVSYMKEVNYFKQVLDVEKAVLINIPKL